MRSTFILLLVLVVHFIHARPHVNYDDVHSLFKKDSTDGAASEQQLVLAKLEELLGPEAFAESFDSSHGRLSNLQRLG
ncbi:unnamed protein product [Caenorhabditis bovis]|uniref:Uncharacterized protein n=1 Tax=Caenorhabditis bovis TaxID=2654633 RepID=A0A8S1EVZ7_9PELO|nr:unnamed protein product [Caenorhabditis bovis]